MPGQVYPTAFNQTVSSTDRLERLNNPAIRGGILRNLDEHLFVSNMILNESIPAGNMFKEYWRYSDIGSEIHDVGDEILAMGTKREKRRIFLDDRPRVSKDSFDEIEEYLSDWSAQQKTAERMGVEHAQQLEIYAIKLAILASRTARSHADFLGGGFDNNGTGAVVNGSSETAVVAAGTTLVQLDAIDKHWFDISMNSTSRTALVNSDIWYALRDRDDVFHGLPIFHGDMVTNASPSPAAFADPNSVLMYKGFSIVRSQLGSRVLGVDLSSDRYQPGDFSSTLGVVFAPECAALIRSRGVTVEAYRDPSHLANHIQSTMLLGGGTIYPEQSIELTGTLS